MPTVTALDEATAMIEKAWDQPIEILEPLAIRRPSADPLLRAAIHVRSTLAITDSAATVHQNRLHALTRPGYVPAFYEPDRIISSAADLRVAQAENQAYLQSIQAHGRSPRSRRVRGPAPGSPPGPGRRRPTGHVPHTAGQVPDLPAPSAGAGPSAPASVPRR
ncbi:hypothetical protein ACFVTY_09365 [Streptomyces sp. NPDC058067]|uniref:hypothetical protein n=1 Tax=Streptomyces sp. NPDC058067 TaxID=3346324 RepID=UPI0036E2F3F7